MKMLFVVLSMTLIAGSASAANKCNIPVVSAYQEYIQNETQNQFEAIEAVQLRYALDSIRKSQELNDEEKAQAIKIAQRPSVLFYEGTSSYRGGTGLEILIVDSASCRILKTVLWYAE